MASQETLKLPSSSHRLPTVSASQALQKLQGRGSRAVSTGLSQLNTILSPPGFLGRNISGGYMRGKVTEIFGPSGVGKTAFGIQAAANALCEDHAVVWVDAACAPLAAQRFNDILLATHDASLHDAGAEVPAPPEASVDELQSHFHHFTVPTLAHLLALFVHQPPDFPPPNTSLIVIDSLSTLFDNAYPRNVDDRASKSKTEHARWAAGRKFAVLSELISTLAKVAALHDIALLLTCQTITRIRNGSRALLVPAISSADWESGISTRLVLFRDWIPAQGKWSDVDANKLLKARFVGVLKANGAILTDEEGVGKVLPFAIENRGLCDMKMAAVDIAAPTDPPLPLQPRPLKRRFTEIGDEGGEDPDSDELYGWVEDDEVTAEGLLIGDEPVPDEPTVAESGAISGAESPAIRVEERPPKVTRHSDA